MPGISFLKPDEQLVLYSPSKISVVNGPRVAAYMPGIIRGKKRKALQLSETEYAKIKNTLTGNDTVVKGPTLHFLGPYDEHKDTIKGAIDTGKDLYHTGKDVYHQGKGFLDDLDLDFQQVIII